MANPFSMLFSKSQRFYSLSAPVEASSLPEDSFFSCSYFSISFYSSLAASKLLASSKIAFVCSFTSGEGPSSLSFSVAKAQKSILWVGFEKMPGSLSSSFSPRSSMSRSYTSSLASAVDASTKRKRSEGIPRGEFDDSKE